MTKNTPFQRKHPSVTFFTEVVAGKVEQMLDSARQLLIAVTAMYHFTDPAVDGTHLEKFCEQKPIAQ